MKPENYATAFGGNPGAGPCVEVTGKRYKMVLGGGDQLAMVGGGSAPVAEALMIIRCVTPEGNLDWPEDARRLLVAVAEGFTHDTVVSPLSLAGAFDLSALQARSSLHGSKALSVSALSSSDLYLLGLRDYRRWQSAQDKVGAGPDHLASMQAEIEACHSQNCFDALHAIRRWSAIPDGQWAVTLSTFRKEMMPMFVGTEEACACEYERAKGALWQAATSAKD